tara:strand:+ start:6141 stop:6569 length:429 start_codon:yes stop_codon:yes gene_type:complete
MVFTMTANEPQEVAEYIAEQNSEGLKSLRRIFWSIVIFGITAGPTAIYMLGGIHTKVAYNANQIKANGEAMAELNKSFHKMVSGDIADLRSRMQIMESKRILPEAAKITRRQGEEIESIKLEMASINAWIEQWAGNAGKTHE